MTEEALDLGPVGPDVLEIISEFISLACISILASALGSKTFGERIKSLNYGRFMVILLYALSWAFAATSAVVISTNDNNLVSCTIGMLSCDIFYAAVRTPRLQTIQYKVHLVMLCPYVVIFALMLSYRNIYLESDGSCTIGLKLIASIPLLVYDFLLNFYLTWLFMAPLTNVGLTTKANWRKSRLYRLARRTLVASIVSLLISFINVLVVVITKGHERGLVCLTMCTVDVTVNVVTVHWVTNNRTRTRQDNGREKTYHEDNLSVEMTFDTAIPKEKPPAAFQLNLDTDLDKESKDRESNESLKSMQPSHSSAKPLR